MQDKATDNARAVDPHAMLTGHGADRLLATTLRSIGDGVIATDAEQRITFMNPVAETLTGWPLAEAVGRPVRDVFHIVHERTREPARNPLDQVLGAGVVALLDNHTILIDRNGVQRAIEDSGAPIQEEGGELLGGVLVFREVTEQRRADIAARRLAAIVESSEDAIVAKDLNGIVTDWNAAAERIYGWPAKEIIGRSKALVMPPDMPDELPNILRTIRAGKSIQHYETQRIRKDGTRMDVSISVSPVRNAHGEIIGAATIVRDITEEKRQREELKAREQELLRRQEQIDALNERLRRAMVETHHRVKNNLQVVSALVDMQIADGQASVSREQLVRIGGHIRALAAMHELLMQSARGDETAATVPARNIFERLEPLLTAAAGNVPIAFDARDVPLTSRQGTAVAVLVNELVSNAVKHGAPPVVVSLTAEDGRAWLVVEDGGPGFPEGFSALEAANTGLDIVVSVAETDLQGDVEFGNGTNGGARVRVTFPLAAA